MSPPAPAPAEPAAAQPRLRPTRAETLVLAAVAAALAFQLFVPPLVGLADNADFARVMWRFGITTPPETPPADRFFIYFISRYAIDPQQRVHVPFITSEVLLAALAVPLSRAFSPPGSFDIRFLGAVHAAFLLAGLWLLMAAGRFQPRAGRIVWAGLLALAFTDVGYVAYLDSFYSEPASLVFLMCCTGLLLLVIAGRAELPVLLAAGAFLLLFVTAKPQNFSAGVPLAVVVGRLIVLRRDRLWKAACLALAALVLCTSALMFRFGNSVEIRELAMQVAVFYGVLRDSPTAEADLREMGLPAKLARYAGMHPWATGAPSREDPQFRRQFVDRMSARRLLAFHARHPRRLWTMMDKVARGAFWPRPPLGNFEKSAGRPAFTQTRTFALWSRLKQRLAPRSLAGVLAAFALPMAAGLVLYLRRPGRWRLSIELFWALALAALGQIPVIAISTGGIDTVKHTFLFKAAADLCIIGAAAWLAGEAARAWAAR